MFGADLLLRRVSGDGLGMGVCGMQEVEMKGCRRRSTVYWPSIQVEACPKVRELAPSVRVGQSISPAIWSETKRSWGWEGFAERIACRMVKMLDGVLVVRGGSWWVEDSKVRRSWCWW